MSESADGLAERTGVNATVPLDERQLDGVADVLAAR